MTSSPETKQRTRRQTLLMMGALATATLAVAAPHMLSANLHGPDRWPHKRFARGDQVQVLFPLKYLKNRQTCLIGDVLDRVSGLKAFTDRYVAQCLYQVHWITPLSAP